MCQLLCKKVSPSTETVLYLYSYDMDTNNIANNMGIIGRFWTY